MRHTKEKYQENKAFKSPVVTVTVGLGYAATDEEVQLLINSLPRQHPTNNTITFWAVTETTIDQGQREKTATFNLGNSKDFNDQVSVSQQDPNHDNSTFEDVVSPINSLVSSLNQIIRKGSA